MMNVLYVCINRKCVKECTHVISLVVFVMLDINMVDIN